MLPQLLLMRKKDPRSPSSPSSWAPQCWSSLSREAALASEASLPASFCGMQGVISPLPPTTATTCRASAQRNGCLPGDARLEPVTLSCDTDACGSRNVLPRRFSVIYWTRSICGARGTAHPSPQRGEATSTMLSVCTRPVLPELTYILGSLGLCPCAR